MTPSYTPLSRHLLRAALLATLFPLLLMVALGLWQYQKDIHRIETFTGEESVSAAGVVANFMDFLVDDTRSLLLRMVDETEKGRVTVAMLRHEGDIQPQTEGLEVTDAKGIIRLSTIGQQGRDVSKLSYFQDALHGAPIAYSEVYHAPWLGQQVVMIAVPYHRHGAFGGVVMARLNLRSLHAFLSKRLQDPRLRNTFVVDRHGTLISHYDYKLVEAGANFGDRPGVKAALSGESGWIKHQVSGESGLILGHVTMPGSGWTVVTTRKAGDTLLQVDERLRDQLALSGLAGLLVALGALVWGRRLSMPVEMLAGTMRQGVGSGFKETDLPEVLPAPTRVAEYQTLTECYNAMAAELNNRFTEILTLQKELQAKNKALQAQNEELTTLSAQANESNRLKSQFLANMSHELRTPLNSIIGFTDLVLTDPELTLDEESRVNLEIVARSGRHLLSLINGILDLSKIESGRTTIFVTTFDVESIVDDVVQIVTPMAMARQLGVQLDVAPDIGRVDSDETKVRQIILNLVSNAIKFTHEGGVTVTVRPTDSDRWTVVVADTGVGIAPEHQELVFEEFRQVDGTTTRRAGGTGLGLAIARKLARLLGGDITLKSEVGRGSTFTLELPRHLDPIEGEALFVSELAATPELQEPGQAANQLVVAIDDDPQSLYLITEKLKGTPFTAVPAGTGEDGARLAKEIRPYAMTLDIKIRRQDDWKILRDLKADPLTADIPVVVFCFEEQKSLAFALGAAAFLTKPIDRERLLPTLLSLHADSPVGTADQGPETAQHPSKEV